MLAGKETTLRQLRKMLLNPATTEKTRAVLERAGIEPEASEAAKLAAERKKRQGHGRNPARAYEGARKVKVTHSEMKSGDRCPECVKGKVYPLKGAGGESADRRAGPGASDGVRVGGTAL